MRKLILILALVLSPSIASAQFAGGGDNGFLELTCPGCLSLSGGILTGPLLLPDGTVNNPSIAFSSDNDGTGTGIYRGGPDTWAIASNGIFKLVIDTNSVDIYDLLNMRGNQVYSSTVALKLCGNFSTSRGLGTGDGGCSGAFEVDGTAWLDGGFIAGLASLMQDNIGLSFGASNDYTLEYGSAGTEMVFKSTDVNGSGTDGNIFTVQDGTDDVVFWGVMDVVGNLTAAKMNSDTHVFAGANYKVGFATRTMLHSEETGDLVLMDYAMTGYDSFQLGPAMGTDADPSDVSVLAPNAWAQATGIAQQGGDLWQGSGLGTFQIVCDDFADGTLDEMVIETTKGGVTSTVTMIETAHWDCNTSNEVCCDNLGTRIVTEYGAAGDIVPDCDTTAGTCYLQPAADLFDVQLSITNNAGDPFATLVEGADGTMVLPEFVAFGGKTASYPALYSDGAGGVTLAGGDAVTDVMDATITGDLDVAGTLTLGSYTRHHDVDPGALSVVGAGSPTLGCCGSLCGSGLDAANEILAEAVEIPSEWDGSSNMILHIHTIPTASDPFAAGEDVDLDFEWRSIDPTSEAGTTGMVAADTVTYTQSGAGAECEVNVFVLTIPYTGGNQPIVAGDDLGLRLWRDPVSEASSYSGAITIYKVELIYTAVGVATH